VTLLALYSALYSRLSVRQSVCLSHLSTAAASCSRFAAEHPRGLEIDR